MHNSKFRYTYIQKISNRLVKKILLSLVDKKGILAVSHRLDFAQVTRSTARVLAAMQSSGISDRLEGGGEVLKMHFQVYLCVSMLQHSKGRAKIRIKFLGR